MVGATAQHARGSDLFRFCIAVSKVHVNSTFYGPQRRGSVTWPPRATLPSRVSRGIIRSVADWNRPLIPLDAAREASP